MSAIAPPIQFDTVDDSRRASTRRPGVLSPASAAAEDDRVVNRDIERLARGLGWFSLGLGLAQIAAPGKVARIVGMPGDDKQRNVIRAVGVREIASGIGILTQAKPTSWLWTRVGGDAMDLALLRSAKASPEADRNRLAAATAAVLGMAVADTLVSTRIAGEPDAPYEALEARDVRAVAAVTINAPLDEIYGSWDGFAALPSFMSDFASVQVIDSRQSRWSMEMPAGKTLEWDVEIIDASPDAGITWQTAENASVDARGHVVFRPAPGNQGTEVIFDVQFSPPGGELGKSIAGLLAGGLGMKLGSDLRRFKQLVELGEIVHSDDSIVKGPNPARPDAAARNGASALWDRQS